MGYYDKITTLATDNARNVTAAVAMLPFEHMPCAAHSLQLSVRKALDVSGVEAVLANDVELHTEQSKLNQKSESLMQDVSTRWNSTLQMIQRLTRNKAAVFDNPHHKHYLFLQNESEWEKLRIMETLLEPGHYATELLGGERYISCTVVLPTMCHLFRAMTVW